MTTVVFIHGAFHGGWCWRAAADRLRAEGHYVLAPSLTGLADRSHLMSPAVDLETHIRDIVNLFEWEDLDNAVLVAHSYGGMPVTGAADRIAGRLSGLVYLDAYTPGDGDDALSVRSSVPGAMPLNRTADGLATVPPDPAAFGLTGAIAEQAKPKLTPHPLATLTQPVRLTGAWREVPRKLYIRTTGFVAPYFDRYYAAASADPGWVAVSRDVGHNVMMTDPDWFVGEMRQHVL